MKVLVLGSTGMAGNVISQYLSEQGYEVYRTSRSENLGKYSRPLDVTNFGVLEAWLDELNPDIVVNCVGLLEKACADRPDLGVLMNAYLPRRLEAKYKNSSTRIIQLSTDCVFSGARGSYREDDVTDGTSVYDRSKALGELKNDKDLTFRMSIIGPDIDPNGIGLFNWFMSQKGAVQGWSKAIWNGVSTIELARGIDGAIRQNLSGLYQFVPNETISKFELLKLFRKVFKRDDIIIEKVDGLDVNKTLLCTRKDFNFAVKSYPEQIEDMKDWVYAHPSMYPHYFAK